MGICRTGKGRGSTLAGVTGVGTRLEPRWRGALSAGRSLTPGSLIRKIASRSLLSQTPSEGPSGGGQKGALGTSGPRNIWTLARKADILMRQPGWEMLP